MNTLINILITIMSLFMLVFTAAGFFLSGVMGSFGFDSSAGALMMIIPAICLIIAILGFCSVFKKHRPSKYAFSLLLLVGWPAGTIIGVVLLTLLFASRERESQPMIKQGLNQSAPSESH